MPQTLQVPVSIMDSFPMFPMRVRVMMLGLFLGFGLYAAGCGSISMGRRAPAETPETPPESVDKGDDTPLTDRELTGDMNEPVFDTSSTPTSDSTTSGSVSSMPASGGDTSRGYRVQIYSFTDRDAAASALKRVEQYLADWSYSVYLDEEGGNFKIRVGDFTEKAAADLLRDRLRREGYPDAWTAPVRVEAP